MNFRLAVGPALFLMSAAATAAPTVDGNTISWPDDGWYQVQVVEDDGIFEVCQGGLSCEVTQGEYIVINHSTGERFKDIFVSGGSTTERITVSGNVISWPDDGWYQVQDEATYSEVCGGTQSCIVAPGAYVVINHSTGERFEGIEVTDGGTGESPITVTGNVISWPDDGWYQVQSADGLNSICNGELSCSVESGTYIVINHTTNTRYKDIVVSDGSSPINNNNATVSLVSFNSQDNLPLNSSIQLPQGGQFSGGSFANALSEDGRFSYYTTPRESNPGTFVYDKATGTAQRLSLIKDPDDFRLGPDGRTSFYIDGNDNLTFRDAQGGSITLKNLVPGASRVREAIISDNARYIAFIAQVNQSAISPEFSAYVYDIVNGEVRAVAQDITPLRDPDDSDLNWEIDNVVAISADGATVVFGASYTPLPIEDITGLVLARTWVVYAVNENTVDLVGQQVFRIFGSSPTFVRSFRPVLSADGKQLIYPGILQDRWGEVAQNRDVFSYSVDMGVSEELEGLRGASNASFSDDLRHMVYRFGSSIILVDTITLQKTTLTDQAYFYCERACQEGGSDFFNPGISADGSTALYFIREQSGDAVEPPSFNNRLIVHDLITDTAQPLLDVVSDVNGINPFVSLGGFGQFDISADGKTILVAARSSIDLSAPSNFGPANAYLIELVGGGDN